MIIDQILPDGQIVVKKIVPDLAVLDSAIVHHHDSMYQDPAQKERVEWVAKMSTGDKVIEVGTATGYVIAQVKAQTRVGVDNNVARLLLASMRYPEISFYYANIFNMAPFCGQGFDCLIATEILEHLPYDNVKHALYHCLRIAPKLVITLPIDKNVMTNPEHLWHPTMSLLAKALGDTGIDTHIGELDHVGDFLATVIVRRE